MRSASSTGKSNFMGNIVSLLSFAFKLQGVVSITFLIIIFTSGSAMIESFKEGTPVPFISKVGGQLLNHDNELFIEAKNIEEHGGIIIYEEDGEEGFFSPVKHVWQILRSLGKAIVNLWYLYFLGFLFFKFYTVVVLRNTSDPAGGIVLTVISLLVLQLLANAIVLDGTIRDNQKDLELSTAEKFTPLRGLFKFATVTPLIFNPIYEIYTNESLIDPGKNETSAEVPENKAVIEDDPGDKIVNSLSMLTEGA